MSFSIMTTRIGHPVRLVGVVLVLQFSLLTMALAAPYIEAGNRWLRSDIETLADSGVIKAPITQWPIMWASLATDLRAADVAQLDASVRPAYLRVYKAFRRASENHFQAATEMSAATGNAIFRQFGDGSREKREVSGELDWLGDRFALKLKGHDVGNAVDGERSRLDGSYLGFIAGNWIISASALERWWGPGWQGSLILSNNARPIPAISIQRNRAEAFKSPWLSWIGPWTLESFMGKLESNRYVPNARLWGLRGTFKPTQNLEIGFSRTAQWEGQGRPSGLSTFWNVLIGNDNVGANLTRAQEPGNQQAGMDLRWSLAGFEIPATVYMQYVGEDKLIYLIPSKATTHYGVESHAVKTAWGSIRGFAEYYNTSTSGFDSIRSDNTIYEHHIYRSGYRHYGRSLAASWDNDSVVWSLGFIASNYRNQELSLTASSMDLNRDNTNLPFPGGNRITATAVRVNQLDVRYRYYFKAAYLNLEITLADKNLDAFQQSTRTPLDNSAGAQYRTMLSYRREF